MNVWKFSSKSTLSCSKWTQKCQFGRPNQHFSLRPCPNQHVLINTKNQQCLLLIWTLIFLLVTSRNRAPRRRSSLALPLARAPITRGSLHQASPFTIVVSTPSETMKRCDLTTKDSCGGNGNLLVGLFCGVQMGEKSKMTYVFFQVLDIVDTWGQGLGQGTVNHSQEMFRSFPELILRCNAWFCGVIPVIRHYGFYIQNQSVSSNFLISCGNYCRSLCQIIMSPRRAPPSLSIDYLAQCPPCGHCPIYKPSAYIF